GPVSLAVTDAGVQIKQARWTGPQSNLTVSGGVRLEPETRFNLTMQANADLRMIEAFDEDVRSAGAALVSSTVSGPLKEPVVRGRLELKDGALQKAGLLNGITKANSVIELSGTSARIQSF